MESNIIIGTIVGLIIGAVIVFFIKSKPIKENISQKDTEGGLKYNDFQSTIQTLTEEKRTLHKRLLESEKLLESIHEFNNDIPSKVSDKLLKEIKELKDEIEDLEDDLDDQNKSNKKLREEKFKIEEERDNIEKQKIGIVEEKEDLKKELILITDKFNEEKESLDFINEILNAQDSSDKDVEKLNEDTLEIYYFIKNNISNYFKHLDFISDQTWEWRNLELKPWLKNKKKIAIVGEFSAGKTSIINRIISQDDPKAPLLPVSSKETTAIPTYVSKSKDFNCQFYSTDEKLRTVKKETFEMVTKSVLDKVNVNHLIKYFVLSYDNKHLDELSILDTPGFASNSDEIIKRTTDVVKEADALFWVIDANMGDLNQTSIDVMKEHLHELPLYFIINKSDTKSPKELEVLEEKIKQTASNNEIQYNAIICFSQKENLDVLMKHISTIKVVEEDPLMKYIEEVLDEEIINLKKDKEKLIKLRKANSSVLTQREANFRNIQGDIIFLAEKVNNLVKVKDYFFTGTKYQIENSNYTDFKNNIEKIVGLSRGINEEVKFHSEDINKKIELDSDFEDNKQKFDNVVKVRREFVQLIKSYNQNLLN